MRAEEFEQLLESVREGGAILRGEIEPSRAFPQQIASTDLRRSEKAFAICVKTDDPELLIPNKIYQVARLEDDLLKVTDESGDAAIYSFDNFLPISFPPEVEQILALVAEQ